MLRAKSLVESGRPDEDAELKALAQEINYLDRTLIGISYAAYLLMSEDDFHQFRYRCGPLVEENIAESVERVRKLLEKEAL